MQSKERQRTEDYRYTPSYRDHPTDTYSRTGSVTPRIDAYQS